MPDLNQLEHWGGMEEASPSSLPPSLPPCSPPTMQHRDKDTSQLGSTTLCPAPAPPSPSRNLSHPKLHALPLPKPLCPRLPCLGAWVGGFPGTSLSSTGSLPGAADVGRQGYRAALGAAWPAGPQGYSCCFPAPKDRSQEAIDSHLPQTSGDSLAFALLAPDKLQHFACLSWQDMVLGTEEAMEESASVA